MKNKNLIFIGGTMGVGKTTLSTELLKKLDKSVMLDGDWCWFQGNWNFCEENRKMVIDNIAYLLNNFLKNPNFENIIFCWVMHQQSIINDILQKLNYEYNFYNFSLIADENTIRERLKNRIGENFNIDEFEKSVKNSMDRIKCYDKVDSIKIDVSDIKFVEESLKILMNYIK